ncbi:MAG: nucleoside triphosphate pyrophosphohydrolase family protein [Candidatus Aenigmarchaeota archaeon]|nr:nucleoside triphosphate pyrophosphohydrolase family protein [Candidatus Aenigmarchaeota archaeon]
MEFEEYQKKSRETAIYPNKGKNFVYPVLGLLGEAGEVTEKIKKLIRDKEGKIDDEFREKIKKELGDVLWYIAQLCTELNISLDDVAKSNLEKLFSRMERGKLHGSGDER